MSDRGILLRREDPDRRARAKASAAGLAMVVAEDWIPRWPRTLFVAPTAAVPWDLVAFGFRLLERWDAAAPFSRSPLLAQDLGSQAERDATRAVVGDLRIPVYSTELLFVRADGEGQALLQAWRDDCGGEPHLAFLRALARTKPRLCVLPRVWLAEQAVRESWRGESQRRVVRRQLPPTTMPMPARRIVPRSRLR